MVHASGRPFSAQYRETRAGIDMLDACLTPELAAEITLQPVRRYGVDAAIFFSDIVVPFASQGSMSASSLVSVRFSHAPSAPWQT